MAVKVDLEQLEKKMKANNVIILEALPKKYYEMGHLPGAINMPHDMSDTDILSILKDKEAELITYCANGPCRNSEILANRLIALGYRNVADYHLGKENWVRSGRRLTR